MVEAILLQIPPPDQEGVLGTHSKSLCWHCVCGACTPPRSHPPSAGPHTRSLSWHCSHACYQTSSPCASAGPAQRYPHLHWQKYEGTCWPHQTA